MSDKTSEIQAVVKKYILDEFLQGEDPEALTPTVPLITDGIMNSLSNMKLVTFLEEQFNISIAPHEISPEFMDTIEQIADLVASKMSK